MKRLVVICGAGLLGACAPKMQTQVLSEHQKEIAEIKQLCAGMAEGEEDPHVTEITCQRNALGPLLKSRGFQDMDLFTALYDKRLKIADGVDSGKISEEKAAALEKQAASEFEHQYRRRDAIRLNDYAAGMAALGSGMQSFGYVQQPQPYLTGYCPACQQGIQQGQASAGYWQQQGVQQQQTMQSVQNSFHYDNPAPSPMGMAEGARGYNGITGQADMVYTPAGADPNPPPVLGQ